MKVSQEVMTAISGLGWEVGQVRNSHTEWAKLRAELKMSAASGEWRSLCANLINNLQGEGIIKRLGEYKFEVVSADYTHDTLPEDQQEEKKVLLKVSTDLPADEKVLIRRDVAVEQLELYRLEFDDLSSAGEFFAEVTFGKVPKDAARVFLKRSDAISLLKKGLLNFTDIEED